MLKEVNWANSRSYRTGIENPPYQFYLEGLSTSIRLDLLLGYFSSSAINILSTGFAKFLYNGGKLRMVINNILSSHDRDAILSADQIAKDSTLIDLSDVKSLRRTLDDYGVHFFECLAWLITQKRIEFKIVRPSNNKGISHYKSGIFSDGINEVGFKGSCNFTSSGLVDNLEEIDCFLDWDDNRSKNWIVDQRNYFDLIYSGRAPFVEYLDVEDIEVAIKNEFFDKDIDELLVQEKELVERKLKLYDDKNLRKSIEKVICEIEEIIRLPKFPYAEGPREYQKIAYSKWVDNLYKGIFAMATGTGKTITSLNCVLNEFAKRKDRIYHALILVPTITLVKQWEQEARSFNFQEVYSISSKIEWESEVKTLLSTSKRIPVSFILISTYASFVKDKFNSILSELPEDTIFIADEGHNLASPLVKSKLNQISLQKRIGLSATPKRKYDAEGTGAMEDFFHDKEPYTYSFSMERAINEGVLCEYFYYPFIVKLTNAELFNYKEVSDRLSKLYKMGNHNEQAQQSIERLLLERKRIIHKAENKLQKAIEILKGIYSETGNIKYTFVYVPEGDSAETIDDTDDPFNNENVKIIDQYTREIGRINDRILVNQFVSGMKDRDEVLQQFQNGQIDVIASMKCLDEGIDIPRAEKAIFCSSTGNPRQFIQRRGRILRKHKEKRFATIYDLVIIPDYEGITNRSENYDLERSLVKGELERVMYFASLSKNPYYTEEVFSDLCDHYQLNIYAIQNELSTQ
ncbi:MAG: DEAD/DEAH box helicase family protein [Chryseotalea sp.]|jgi:superfamily II DNA or RNA helicase